MMETIKEKETAVSSNRRQVFMAAGLVGALVLLSRVIGLVRLVFVRSTLGAGTLEAEAFEIANRIPETVFLIVAGGAVGAAFIPTFTTYFQRDDEPGGWLLFSRVLNLILAAVSVLSLLAMFFADDLVLFLASDKVAVEPALLPLTALLMRIMLLSTIIFGGSSVIMAALNARQHFFLPALAPSIYNLGIILGGGLWLIWGRPLTAVGFAIGTVAGALGHLLIQVPGLKIKHARYIPSFKVKEPGVIQVLTLMAPRVLGLSFSQLNLIIVTRLTDSMAWGSLVALNTAFRLIILPQGIIGQALGIASFPTMATLAARSAYDEMRQILADSLRLLLFLGLPASLILALLGRPIVAFVFERGMFDAEATFMSAQALVFYALALIPLMGLEVTARTFYALKDTWTPVLAGAAQLLFMWGLSVWFSLRVFPSLGLLPLGGTALGFSLSNFLEAGLLLWLLRRKMGGVNGRSLLDGFWRMGLASLLMAGAIWLTLTWLEQSAALWQAALGSLAGGIVYLLASLGLRVTEMRRFWEYGRRRLSQRRA
ncbi:MAG: murein biosynthesis integral membrane protein MurJ [Chloroflexi bacterium]|nr:murein biosynthesis integral membrane protein MurJ [Chloroflexota bacterium]